MTTDPPPPDATDDVAALLAILRPSGRTPKHVIDDEAWMLMLWRMARALEARAIGNPELLTQVVALAQRLAEIVNVAIYTNAARFEIDPRTGASAAECGRAMGISKQAASQRRALGRAVVAQRIAAAGVARFSEARRERAAITAAAEHAVVSLADWRERKAA